MSPCFKQTARNKHKQQNLSRRKSMDLWGLSTRSDTFCDRCDYGGHAQFVSQQTVMAAPQAERSLKVTQLKS